ncbi:MAG: spore gernimation protein GerB [Neobacillus sp.]|nr:spore gernimation protein GerB [Neobacillus sp.]
MMQSTVKESAMVSPYLLFFLIHGSQTGIGVLRFQSSIIKGAEQDAWVSVLVVGLSLHILFLMILHIIRNSSQGDIISFHTDTFGKIIGGMLNLLLTVYFFSVGLIVVHTYIEILQIWVFDGISSWEFSLVICVLVYYIVSAGFRSITGIAFWGVIIPSFLLFTIFYIMRFANLTYIMPFFNHDLKDYLISAKESGFNYLGFEAVLVYFPFIKNGMKESKWGHFALLYTTILSLVLVFVTFTFFSQGKLAMLSWPTLTMIKVIQFPFLERFEFIFLFTWLLLIFPVICINVWSSVRIVKKTFQKLKATYVLIFVLFGYFLFNSNVVDTVDEQRLNTFVATSGLILIYIYIPFLFIISFIKSKIGKRKQSEVAETEM